MRRRRPTLAELFRALDALADDELYALQREVSRRATLRRLDDPEHCRRLAAGLEVSRALLERARQVGAA